MKISIPNLRKIEETSKIRKENKYAGKSPSDNKKKDSDGFKAFFDQEVEKIKSNNEKLK